MKELFNSKEIYNSCGGQGCDIQPYLLPIGGTEDYLHKVIREKEQERSKNN